MSARLPLLVLLLLAAGLAAPAVAPATVAEDIARVRADYRNDGKIEPCRHTAKALRDTLEATEGNTDRYAPDFPAAVEAALEARTEEDCEREEATPTPTPSATPTPTPRSPPAPDPDPDPVPTAPVAPASPAVRSAPDPPAEPVDPVEPVEPEATPTATPTPTPEATPAAPGPTGSGVTGSGVTPGAPTPAPTDPNVVLKRAAARNSDLGPAPWIVLGGLVGATLLAALIFGSMRRFGWGEERLAPVVHAVGEAGYRTGGTWQAFADWVRRGR